MVQAEIAGRSDVHCRTFADGFHAAEHFDRVGVIVTVASAVSSSDRRHNPVFCFGFDDGSIDLFGGHSAPRENAPTFSQNWARLRPKKRPRNPAPTRLRTASTN